MIQGAVVLVTSADEIATAISFARKHDIEQVIRGGGHGTNGASSTDGGIVVDLSKMNAVTVDPANMTVTAQGGCLWKDVDEAAGDYGLAAVGGTVNHTGVGGLTLGGGYGYLTGRHGLVIDNLLSVKLVTADSEIVTASPDQRPDLFWAVRGAGASFGAVVEFTFRAHQQREPVWAGMAAFPIGKLPAIVKFANDFAQAANPDASFNFGFTTPPDAPGLTLVTLGFYNGLGAQGKKIFGPLFDAGPLFHNFGPMPYCKVNSLLSETSGYGGRKIIGGAACAAPFSPDFYNSVKEDLEAFIKRVPAAKQSLVIFELVQHGRLREVDGEATAFANRGPYYNAVCMTKWQDPADDEKCRDFTYQLRDKVSEHLIKTANLGPEAVGKYANYNGEFFSLTYIIILLSPFPPIPSLNPTQTSPTAAPTTSTAPTTRNSSL